MAEPKTFERRLRTSLKVNLRRFRAEFFAKSIPIPAPIFFLIFLGVGWAGFTLYFKIERTNALLEQLERRTDAVESQLEDYDDAPPELGDEDEFEAPPSSVIEL